MATLQKRGDAWRAVIRRVGFKPISKSFPTKGLAQAWARSVEKDMDARVYRDPSGAAKTSVRELFEQFRDEVCPERRGGKWEVTRIERLLRTAHFVDQRLDRITPEDIRDWRNERLKEVSAPSVNRELNLISGVFSHAIKEWGVALRENPVHLVKRPAGADRARTRRFGEREIAAILEASGYQEGVQPTVGREYVGHAVLLAIETAMRLGEICALRVGDVDFEACSATLHMTKNGDARSVPLSTKARALLRTLVTGRDADEQVVPLTAESLGLYFREARDAAGLQDLHFHDTRHEAATRLSKKLANVLELSAVTGHRSLQSLKRYYNPGAAELAAKLG